MGKGFGKKVNWIRVAAQGDFPETYLLINNSLFAS